MQMFVGKVTIGNKTFVGIEKTEREDAAIAVLRMNGKAETVSIHRVVWHEDLKFLDIAATPVTEYVNRRAERDPAAVRVEREYMNS